MPDFTLADTRYFMFFTATAADVPTTLLGTPIVSAYEDDSVTQITAGITLGVDHDSVTGLNLLTIVATGANGYEAGKQYNLVVTTGTVDSVSWIGRVVATFSLTAEAASVDLANGTDGLGALKAETAAILDDTDLIDDGTSGLAKIATDVAAILDDTDLIDDGTSGLAKIAIDVAAALVDTVDLQAQIGTAGAGLTDLGGMSTEMKAEVNVEVLDVSNTDTITLPGQEAPPLAPTEREMLSWLYKVFRNRKSQTSTVWALYADNESTIDAKAVISDDATTAIKQEIVTGP